MKTKYVFLIGLVAVFASVFGAVPAVLADHGISRLKVEVATLDTAVHLHNVPVLTRSAGQLSATLNTVMWAGRLLFYVRAIPHWGAEYKDTMNLIAGSYDVAQAAHIGLSDLPKQWARHGIRSWAAALPAMSADFKALVPWVQRGSEAWSKVTPADLPHALSGQWHRIHEVQTVIPLLAKYIPLLASAGPTISNVLGENHLQRYLILFENSGELRATGGFITAYGDLAMNHGKVVGVLAQNIYLLADKIRYRPLAPPLIHRYLYTWHWHIRDANWSPNVPSSVADIKRFYDSIPQVPKINGMFFVTTWFVDQILADVGPIRVTTGQGPVTINAQNANYEMEYMAEKSGLTQLQRKAFIASMMKRILGRAFSARGPVLYKILNTVWTGLNQKLLILNFDNAEAQSLAQRLNWAGTIDRQVAGNYLEVVDENLGGHKDNYFIHEHVMLSVDKRAHSTLETIRITWINPAPPDGGWLVVPYTAWIRVYLPLGAKLVGIRGQNGPVEQYVNGTVDKTV
ncbi:MAG: DUF4012 domain-containing protein, partial [Sulfobacillus sp.]